MNICHYNCSSKTCSFLMLIKLSHEFSKLYLAHMHKWFMGNKLTYFNKTNFKNYVINNKPLCATVISLYRKLAITSTLCPN